MRIAIRDQQFRKALVICERIAATLRTRVGESAARPATGNGHDPTARVRLSKVAHRLGIDQRTLRRHVAREDFIEHPVPRVWLVDEARFDRWFTARGRKL